MAYGRRTYAKRRYSRRRRPAPRTRRSVYGAAASQLYKDVRTLKNLINVEFKHFDTQSSTSTVSTTGTIIPLNLIPQGDGASSRDGDMFRMKSLELSGSVENNSAVVTTTFTRLDLILDTDPDGAAAPTLSDIYDTTGSVPYYYALRNLNNRSRYVILKSVRFSHSPNGNEGSNFHWYKKLDLKTLFTPGTNTIAGCKKNLLFMVLSSDKTSNWPTVNLKSRIRYIDN